jgi:hypothetical protein
VLRGFAVGTLALAALYVALQPGVADKLGIGSNALVQLFRRALSPDVAAIRQTGVAKAEGQILTIPGTGGGRNTPLSFTS